LIASSPLGRDEISLPLPDLAGALVAVTGGDGFIGRRITDLLWDLGAHPFICELPHRDVLKPETLPTADWCLHLAAHKYATSAEDTPAEVAELNVRGTANVIERYGSNVVLASTCKAADPMTVYGASKLIAERVALNADARVVRFVNVFGSTGSVVPMWEATPADQPLTVMPATRMWMTPGEAASLMVAATGWGSGRYALDVPAPESVSKMARRLHPGREVKLTQLRRGDRAHERLVGEYEWALPHGEGVVQIIHPFDRA
jgi:UDP-N-acetylglucosamine 4,6-dehydratase